MIVAGIRHVSLEVKDMDKMIVFYKKLGFVDLFWDKYELPEHTGFKEVVRTVKLRTKSGGVLELTQNHPHPNHFALDVTLADKPVQWIEDPDGNKIEMVLL